LLGSLDRFSTVGGLAADPPGILLFQEGPEAPAHKFAIVYHEDSDGRRFLAYLQNRHTKPYDLWKNVSIHRIA
jgi:hypothetical protein